MERKNIDDLALQIMGQQVAQDLHKALPPRIAYRLRAWFKRQGRHIREQGAKKVAQEVARKMEEVIAVKELKKNQFMARVHDDGVVKMDFGAEVPDNIRKAAMAWAKRKGLKPVEASLNKSENSPYSMTYTGSGRVDPRSQLLAQYVWEIPQS